jgi:hypothetical protein
MKAHALLAAPIKAPHGPHSRAQPPQAPIARRRCPPWSLQPCRSCASSLSRPTTLGSPPQFSEASGPRFCLGRIATSLEPSSLQQSPPNIDEHHRRPLLGTNSGQKPSRGEPYTFLRAFPHSGSPPLAGISSFPPTAASQGPNCESQVLSRDSFAQQGYICEFWESFKDPPASSFSNSIDLLLGLRKFIENFRKNKKMQTQFC